MQSHLIRFLRFTLVGGLATGIQYALLIILVRRTGISPTPASCIGFVISAVFNYLLNYHYTFRSKRPHVLAAAKFGLLAGTGLLINGVIMYLLVGARGHYLIAQACATAIVLLWNFAGNSFWTFGTVVMDENGHT